MTAVAWGLGAAFAWAATILSSGAAARRIGSPLTLGWVMGIGLALSLPVLATGPAVPGGGALVWLGLYGAANVGGLLLQYRALQSCSVAIIAQVNSAEGMVAALLAVVAGESMAVSAYAFSAVIVVGLALTTRSAGASGGERGRGWERFAIGSTLLFGLSLFALARSSAEASIAVAILPARIVGVACFTAPLVAQGRLRTRDGALRFATVSALGEVVGALCFAIGSRDSTAVTAMFATQFAALATLGAVLLHGERLRRVQVGGLVLLAVGAGGLGAVSG